MSTSNAWYALYEYIQLKERENTLAESCIETALHLEDLFDIQLTDDHMTAKYLGTSMSIHKLVEEKLNVRNLRHS